MILQSPGLAAAIVAIGFALLARIIGSVTDGGAVVGALAAFVLMWAAGMPAFVPLLAVFAIAALTTRWGRERKLGLGVAERHGGRTGSQIAANLSAAALCALPLLWFPQFYHLLLLGAMAALAEAAADTASSEIGEATADAAYCITTLRRAPIGSNGAISVEGTLSGCIAACVVAWVGVWSGLVAPHRTPLIALAGIAGMVLDSLLGATWESAGKMGNNSVNFVSTVFAADLALAVAMLTA